MPFQSQNLVPIADDVLDLIRSRGILFSVAAQNLVQFYFKIGNSVKAHELVQQIRASGAPYTSSIYLSLFQKQTDDMRLLLLGKAFDDPECKILPDALVCAITCFWNANDEKTAISTFDILFCPCSLVSVCVLVRLNVHDY